jgi:hypothetical protein
MRIGLKIVAALLFMLVTPRAVMGEVFEVVGAGSAVHHAGSATVAEPDGDSGPDMGEGQGPTKPRWAIPRRWQLGQLPGTGFSTPSAEQQEQASSLLGTAGTGGTNPTPNRH